MYRKFWLGTGLIFIIVLAGLLSMDAKQHPARAAKLKVTPTPTPQLCTGDFGSISTTTRIQSDNPDPSKAGESFYVSWIVYNIYFMSDPPVGTVTVSGGGSSCTGSAPAGSCQLTISTRGSYVITARFGGGPGPGACWYRSSSDTEPHTVTR